MDRGGGPRASWPRLLVGRVSQRGHADGGPGATRRPRSTTGSWRPRQRSTRRIGWAANRRRQAAGGRQCASLSQCARRTGRGTGDRSALCGCVPDVRLIAPRLGTRTSALADLLGTHIAAHNSARDVVGVRALRPLCRCPISLTKRSVEACHQTPARRHAADATVASVSGWPVSGGLARNVATARGRPSCVLPSIPCSSVWGFRPCSPSTALPCPAVSSSPVQESVQPVPRASSVPKKLVSGVSSAITATITAGTPRIITRPRSRKTWRPDPPRALGGDDATALPITWPSRERRCPAAPGSAGRLHLARRRRSDAGSGRVDYGSSRPWLPAPVRVLCGRSSYEGGSRP